MHPSQKANMHCDVCTRSFTKLLPCLCTTCARNELYEPRMRHAQTLLHRGELGSQIEHVLSDTTSRGTSDGAPESEHISGELALKKAARIHVSAAEQQQSTVRTNDVLEHVALLKEEIALAREDIAKRKAELSRRRRNAEVASRQLRDHKSESMLQIERTKQRKEKHWNMLHSETAKSRVFLCREAANLYGLKRIDRGRAGPEYVIGGVPILDLRNLNSSNASAAQISASLMHVTHLLVLISNYLSLRLPAEITLPHRNYPQPTIFMPASSYLSKDVPFPGFPSSSSNSPISSAHPDSRPLPRPRPLYIERKLIETAKEDPTTYSYFIEGVCLLAWDVAWACRSQGLNVGETWEGACNMGRNLYQLLVAAQPAMTPLMRVLSSRGSPPRNKTGAENGGLGLNNRKAFPMMLGQFSHGTAHSNLASAEGVDFMRGWRMPSAVKIADRLKNTLISEMATAEWELLDEQEWGDAQNLEDRQPTHRFPRDSPYDSDGQEKEGRPRAAAKDRTGSPAPPLPEASRQDSTRNSTILDLESNPDRRRDTISDSPSPTPVSRAPGTSGWTKVKHRGT